jgi:hypothetical protein
MNMPPPPLDDNSGIPHYAQALMMQPQAYESLKDVDGFNLLLVYSMQMPFMLLPRQQNELSKILQKVVSLSMLGVMLGVVTNVQIKRVSLRILELPLPIRYPIRLGLMLLPFLPLYSPIAKQTTLLHTLTSEVTVKKNELIRTKDLYKYFEVEKKKLDGKTTAQHK